MHPRRIPGLALRAITLTAALLNCAAWAQGTASSCGPLDNPYGPFDYVTQKNLLGVVEKHHFTPRVEALVGGVTSVHVGEDIDYTLKAFPNHHRALLSLARLGKKTNSSQPVGLAYAVECYFERALRFRPSDGIVRMIYARYLFQDRRAPQASQQLEQAVAAADDDPFIHYNVGLLYLEHENYALALAHAHKAYALGFAQTALRDRLQLLGKWKEPG